MFLDKQYQEKNTHYSTIECYFTDRVPLVVGGAPRFKVVGEYDGKGENIGNNSSCPEAPFIARLVPQTQALVRHQTPPGSSEHLGDELKVCSQPLRQAA